MNVYHELARKQMVTEKTIQIYGKKAILRTYHATGGKVDNSLMHRSVESYGVQQKQIIVFRNDTSVNCFVFILTVFPKFNIHKFLSFIYIYIVDIYKYQSTNFFYNRKLLFDNLY